MPDRVRDMGNGEGSSKAGKLGMVITRQRNKRKPSKYAQGLPVFEVDAAQGAKNLPRMLDLTPKSLCVEGVKSFTTCKRLKYLRLQLNALFASSSGLGARKVFLQIRSNFRRKPARNRQINLQLLILVLQKCYTNKLEDTGSE